MGRTTKPRLAGADRSGVQPNVWLMAKPVIEGVAQKAVLCGSRAASRPGLAGTGATAGGKHFALSDFCPGRAALDLVSAAAVISRTSRSTWSAVASMTWPGRDMAFWSAWANAPCCVPGTIS